MNKSFVSVVIRTLNEEENISYALRSVRSWASEIIVVDMHSTDNTVKIAQEYGAKVYLYDRIFAFDGVCKFAIEKATNPWVLLLDADEIIPEPLSVELIRIAKEDWADAAELRSVTYFQGVPVQHCWGVKYAKLVRFFKKEKVILTDKIHNFVQFPDGAKIIHMPPVANAMIAIHHYSYTDISDYLERLDRYTNIEAIQRYNMHEKFCITKALWKTIFMVVNLYVRRQGYRDGWLGLQVSLLSMMYNFVAYSKLRELYVAGSRRKIEEKNHCLANDLLKKYEE